MLYLLSLPKDLLHHSLLKESVHFVGQLDFLFALIVVISEHVLQLGIGPTEISFFTELLNCRVEIFVVVVMKGEDTSWLVFAFTFPDVHDEMPPQLSLVALGVQTVVKNECEILFIVHAQVALFSESFEEFWVDLRHFVQFLEAQGVESSCLEAAD